MSAEAPLAPHTATVTSLEPDAWSDDIPAGLRAHRCCLERIARFLTRDLFEADDLVQDTCRRALEARTFFAPGTNLKAWLIRILRNLHIDRRRVVSREVPFDSLAELNAFHQGDQNGDRDLLHGDDDLPSWRRVSDQEVTTAVESIPITYRQTYRMFAIDGLSYLDIAARTGVASGTVATRIRRARLWLRRRLADDGATRPRARGKRAGAC